MDDETAIRRWTEISGFPATVDSYAARWLSYYKTAYPHEKREYWSWPHTVELAKKDPELFLKWRTLERLGVETNA